MSALNLPKITIGQVKDKLIQYYKRGIESGEDLERLRAVFLWSLPGIGKSQMATQVVEALRDLLHINVEFREIRLSDCTIFELLGLMHQNPGTPSEMSNPNMLVVETSPVRMKFNSDHSVNTRQPVSNTSCRQLKPGREDDE